MSRTPVDKAKLRPLVALIVAVLGLVLLATVQQFPNRHRMEADLTQRSQHALRSAGLSDVRVAFTGRDGTLTAATSADAERALGIVRDLEGVRAAEAEVPPATATETPSVRWSVRDGRASITGTVPTEASRAALVDAATAIGVGIVENGLTVDARVTDAALPGLPAVLHALGGHIDGVRMELGGGTLTLTGAVGSEVDRNAVLTAARGTGATVVDRMEVPDVGPQLGRLPRLTFATGTTSLTAESEATLRTVAKILTANPSVRLRIEGHTDSTGSVASNFALSRERATAVRDFLAQRYVPVDRLSVRGYGEAAPLLPNSTAANRAENRRVELIVSGAPAP
ncbi:OmpA family protein [Micromonospora krabiensis]|uniref:BON domain-containing protein n=1 Tax=Micromonospora krabiensis TaxID=307121 RepID=A0A1C3NE45_9ACTN|nr:OmpA family protein [Micromonospora krabiensis]SBV30830.1 BON domain-containing protein [Micromonospora krabiensis]